MRAAFALGVATRIPGALRHSQSLGYDQSNPNEFSSHQTSADPSQHHIHHASRTSSTTATTTTPTTAATTTTRHDDDAAGDLTHEAHEPQYFHSNGARANRALECARVRYRAGTEGAHDHGSQRLQNSKWKYRVHFVTMKVKGV